MNERLAVAYLNYRNKVLGDFGFSTNLLSVILISPKAFLQLENENTKMKTKDGYHYVDLCGTETPLIIRSDIPEDTNFIIMSLEDYRRLENE